MLNREETKNKLWQFLKQQCEKAEKADPPHIPCFQLNDINTVIFINEFRGLAILVEQEKFRTIVKEILSEWVTAGLLYIGQPGNSADGFPYFTITEYGKKCLDEDNWLPYDPEGYLREFKMKVPQIDDISLKYIAESVQAYNRHMLLSATVTLGVASENAILQLIEAFIVAIGDSKRQISLQKKLQGRNIAAQFRFFKEELEKSIKAKKIPENFVQERDTYLIGIFSSIRLNRNDAGHPTGKNLNIKALYANLQMLPDYLAYVFKFIDFLRQNKV